MQDDKAGWPGWTPELSTIRREQRQVLRSIPDHLLSPPDSWHVRLPDLRVNGFAAEDRLLLEGGLRKSAARIQIQDETLSEVLARLQNEQPARALEALLSDIRRSGDNTDVLIEDELEAVRSERTRVGQIDGMTHASISRLVVLLDLADQLADDGYRDPRLVTHADPGADNAP